MGEMRIKVPTPYCLKSRYIIDLSICILPVGQHFLFAFLDSPEPDSAETGSVSKTESSVVQLDSKQISLFRGSREYQKITVEYYFSGIL